MLKEVATHQSGNTQLSTHVASIVMANAWQDRHFFPSWPGFTDPSNAAVVERHEVSGGPVYFHGFPVHAFFWEHCADRNMAEFSRLDWNLLGCGKHCKTWWETLRSEHCQFGETVMDSHSRCDAKLLLHLAGTNEINRIICRYLCICLTNLHRKGNKKRESESDMAITTRHPSMENHRHSTLPGSFLRTIKPGVFDHQIRWSQKVQTSKNDPRRFVVQRSKVALLLRCWKSVKCESNWSKLPKGFRGDRVL